MGYNYIGIVSVLHNHQYPTDSNTFYQENYCPVSMKTEREESLLHSPSLPTTPHLLSPRTFHSKKGFLCSNAFSTEQLFVIPVFSVPSFLLESS